MSEEYKKIWCDNYDCLYCVNDTCTREPKRRNGRSRNKRKERQGLSSDMGVMNMSGLISREKLIEEITKAIRTQGTGVFKAGLVCAKGIAQSLPSVDTVSREDYHNLLTALDDVDRALRRYQAKDEHPSAESGWIPCSERLPSVSGTYLTTTAKGSVCTDHFYNSMTDIGGRHWSYYRCREPIAWMPLPKPYREDGEA